MASFKILHRDGKARVGELKTAHGVIETPNFNPVGTQASVKALSPKDLQEIGVQMILANTYHLMLRPGVDVIQKLGGLHKFMGWKSPIMTDSGGFQVFSLGGGITTGASKVVNPSSHPKGGDSKTREILALRSEPRPRLNQITEEGVTFQSHLDGSKHMLGPETSIKLQFQLGADLIVAFDDHEYKDTKEHLKKSLALTDDWALRSFEEYRRQLSALSCQTRNTQSLKAEDRRLTAPIMYGVIHGGTNKELRIRSAQFTDKHFDAIALGGIYGTKKQMYQMIDYVLPGVSDEKVRHLLGIGEIEDLFNGIERGIDMFDCVAPTRRARNGSLYICPKCGGSPKNNFTTGITLSKFTKDKNPIDPHCNCYTCQNFSKAYLRHLFMAKEILFHQLATYHNVYFLTKLVGQIRKSIKKNNFSGLKSSWLKN